MKNKNKKQTVIINSALLGTLVTAGAIGTAVSLTSCKKGEEKPFVTTELYFNKNQTSIASVDKIKKPNSFAIVGQNLRKSKSSLFKIKNGTKNVKFTISSKKDDKIVFTISDLLAKDAILSCEYNKEEIATFNYVAYPIFDETTGIKPNSKNEPEYKLTGDNLNLLKESDFKIFTPDNKNIDYKFIRTKNNNKEITVRIVSKLEYNTDLYCKYNNLDVATINYLVPRPEGVSDLIDDYKKNDADELTAQIPETALPSKKPINEDNGFNNNLEVTDEYFMQTKKFKDIANENRAKFFNIAKEMSQNKLKEILTDFNNYKILSNIRQQNDLYTVTCQVNDKSATNLRHKVPFFATKFEFDFRNAKFNLDNQNNLILNDVKTKAIFDNNDNLKTFDDYFKLNNDPKLFNTHFDGIIKSENLNSKLEQWNKERLSNPNFVSSISQNIQNLIVKNVDVYRDLFDVFQELGDLLASNPTVRNFLYGFKSPVIKFLNNVKANQTFINFVTGMFDEKPNTELLKNQLSELYNNKIISKTAYDVLSKGLGAAGSKNIIDYIIDTASSKGFALLLNTAFLIVPKKLKPLKPIILEFVKGIKSISPNNYIGDSKLIDCIAHPKMKFFIFTILKDLRKLIPSGICDVIEMLKPVWDQVKFTTDNLIAVVKSLFNPWIDKFGIDKQMKLSDFFRNNTEVKLVRQTVKANPGYQTLNIDATYRLTFKKNIYISLKPIIKMIESIELTTILGIFNINIPSWAQGLVNFFSDIGKALPTNIFLKEKDYVEFRIQDNNAFLIPNANGYTVKARQGFQLSFSKSLERTYESLYSKYTVWRSTLRRALDPYINTIDNYYLQTLYPTDIMGNIKDPNNTLVSKDEAYNGKNMIDVSEPKLQQIRNNVLRPYLQRKLSPSNVTYDLSFELEDDVKTQVLEILGLDPKIYLNKSKFILNMFPDFQNGATATFKPKMSDITLEMSFATPLMVKDRIPTRNTVRNDGLEDEPLSLWISEFTIDNITY